MVYRTQFTCLDTEIACNQYYTVILSNDLPSMTGNYKAVFECSEELKLNDHLKEILPEGYGLSKTRISVRIGVEK